MFQFIGKCILIIGLAIGLFIFLDIDPEILEDGKEKIEVGKDIIDKGKDAVDTGKGKIEEGKDKVGEIIAGGSVTIDKGKAESAELRKEKVKITNVKDGDTIEVLFANGKKEVIRLLLIDTPESVHPTEPIQKFGVEASKYAKSILREGKTVTIEIGNPERDKYDRLLGYIFVGGKNFNQLMIERGFARVAYIYPPNIKYLDDFQLAEEKAKKSELAIWSIPNYVTDKGFDMSVVK